MTIKGMIMMMMDDIPWSEDDWWPGEIIALLRDDIFTHRTLRSFLLFLLIIFDAFLPTCHRVHGVMELSRNEQHHGYFHLHGWWSGHWQYISGLFIQHIKGLNISCTNGGRQGEVKTFDEYLSLIHIPGCPPSVKRCKMHPSAQ